MASRPPSELLTPLSELDPPEALQRLDDVMARLPTENDPEALREIAAALPARVVALCPEVGRAVVELASALVAHGPRIPNDIDRLEPDLRSKWHRIGLSLGAVETLDERSLLRATHGWSVHSALDVPRLLDRMLAASDARLRSRVLDELPLSVTHMACTPSFGMRVLESLAVDHEVSLRTRAIQMLSASWLAALPPASVRARDALVGAALGDQSPCVVHAAITTAATLGLSESLLALLEDETQDDDIRRRSLLALGPLATDESLEVALLLADANPVSFGPATRMFVLEAHRHGVFVRADHLASLLDQFDAHPEWTGEAFVRVSHLARHALWERLATLPPDDARWIRRAEILAASSGSAVATLLAQQLRVTTDLAVAEALVIAAGRNPQYDEVEPILAWLETLPEAAIPVLHVKGDENAESRLRQMVTQPRFDRAHRRLAFEAAWALSTDRTRLLREVVGILGPHESGLLDSAFLHHRDPTIARIVVDAPWPTSERTKIDPLERLGLLASSGDRGLWAEVDAAFRTCVRSIVGRALAGDFLVKRVELPAVQQQVFRYGRFVVAQGGSVRGFVQDTPETGRDLVIRLASQWLVEEPEPAVMVALLEILGGSSLGGPPLRFVESYWRHNNPEVRRAAIEALVSTGGDARGLELSICRLMTTDDPRLLVQALQAAAVFEAHWAEAMVIAELEHPKMIVKRQAAVTLATIGSTRAVAAIVAWLAHHDNAGFRSDLKAALERAAGPSFVTVLVEALVDETETRRIELLWDALDRRVEGPLALRLARSSRPSDRALVDACLEGRVALQGVSRNRLAALLHRAQLRPKPPVPVDATERLATAGFSPEAALALLATRDADPGAVVATIRAGLAEWIAWLRRESDPHPDALGLVLAAVGLSDARHFVALLDLVARTESVGAKAFSDFAERCLKQTARPLRVRAIEQLRVLPRSPELGGLARYRLLGTLGAQRTRADLERSLDACRVRPDAANETYALLRDALQIPVVRHPEPPEITTLREQAERFYAWSHPEQLAWLDAALDERPLGLALPPPRSEAPPERFVPQTAKDRAALVAALDSADSGARTRAASMLLAWPDAAETWPRVLQAFLHGFVSLTAVELSRVAPRLHRWPETPSAEARAANLLPHCTPRQLRGFAAGWFERWERGDATVASLLASVGEGPLLPWVWSRAEQGDFRPVRLLGPNGSWSTAALVARFSDACPEEFEHLRPRPSAPSTTEVLDPLAGLGPAALAERIADRTIDTGVAVRAVHALARHGVDSAALLRPLVTDRRPPVRSAALRALQSVASRTDGLDAAAEALAMETRRDVVFRLMRTLGHGRHEPSFNLLVDRLTHADARMRQEAHESVRAWGPSVVPALRRALSRARPDRRPPLAQLIAELDAID